jgi:hypothetical protein
MVKELQQELIGLQGIIDRQALVIRQNEKHQANLNRRI